MMNRKIILIMSKNKHLNYLLQKLNKINLKRINRMIFNLCKYRRENLKIVSKNKPVSKKAKLSLGKRIIKNT